MYVSSMLLGIYFDISLAETSPATSVEPVVKDPGETFATALLMPSEG
jgi:hypothetical protein